ncbi:hypothetical protein EVAR_98263_1 [Eumeta japonica]|uniref:Uncharacterized protein n=1 Tax=Eumeta variegata TaxID=151549 RepID=A0A4C1ZXF8_EUMVA|nr:hypothetical protein EVAR_98263_1 [Eumeta japonica]
MAKDRVTDNYKVVIHPDRVPRGEHERRFNARPQNEIAAQNVNVRDGANIRAGRYVSSNEAAWRILGFRERYPAVTHLGTSARNPVDGWPGVKRRYSFGAFTVHVSNFECYCLRMLLNVIQGLNFLDLKQLTVKNLKLFDKCVRSWGWKMTTTDATMEEAVLVSPSPK